MSVLLRRQVTLFIYKSSNTNYRKQEQRQSNIKQQETINGNLIFNNHEIFVVVELVFYSPSKHFMSFRARSVNLVTLFLGKPPRQLTSTYCTYVDIQKFNIKYLVMYKVQMHAGAIS